MSIAEWVARYGTYPAHEWLCGRPTLRELRRLRQLADQPPEAVQRDAVERLRRLLRFAATHLPYYAEQFREAGLDPDAPDIRTALNRLPVLSKDDVRAAGDQMLCKHVPGGPIPYRTGGTTGRALHFYLDRRQQAQRMAARLFMQELFGVRVGDRRAYVWGSPIESVRGRLKRLRDRLINEVLLDAFDMSADRVAAHLDRLRAFEPRVIYGYPSAIALLAEHIARRKQRWPYARPRLIVLTGEETLPEQRAKLQECFGCPVATEYGSREMGVIAHECPQGRLHILTPHVLVEVLRDGRPAPPDKCGQIVATALNARAQPLIRYDLEDAGRLLPDFCPCGLPFPLLQLDGGKITGLLALPGGRLCHGAVSSYVLRDEPGIIQFKTYQRRIDWIEVLLVIDQRFSPRSIERIRQNYRRLIGPQVRVDCRIVDQIPPDPSGKRRHVVSEVVPDGGHFEIVRPTCAGKA